MIIDKILDNYNLPKDIYENINSFLFWDKNSLKYAKFRNEQENIKKINNQIKLSKSSSKNSTQNEDTEDGFWYFENNNVKLCQENCKKCGEYCSLDIFVRRVPNCIICWCDF